MFGEVLFGEVLYGEVLQPMEALFRAYIGFYHARGDVWRGPAADGSRAGLRSAGRAQFTRAGEACMQASASVGGAGVQLPSMDPSPCLTG